MNDEAAFLARIRATPDDLAPRLVYADWLEDNDDPRGELIRVTEEMRTLAPYSDAYWTLKPRRKALRDGVAVEWLEAMRYNDVWPIFTHGWPDDWKGRWRLLREYMERWYGECMPDVGSHRAEVDEIERRAGLRLPLSVREWFSFQIHGTALHYRANWNPASVASGAELLPHNAVALWETHEHGGEICFGVRQEDCTSNDPPVYRYILRRGDSAYVQEHDHECGSVSSLAWYWNHLWMRPRGGRMRVHVRSSSTVAQALFASFPVRLTNGETTYFEKENIHVSTDPSTNDELLVTVYVAKSVPHDDFPACIWEAWSSADNGEYSGLFAK